MKRILITGETGNVGLEVVRALHQRGGVEVRAGVRDVVGSDAALRAYPSVRRVPFDFRDAATYDAALAGCDSLFLLRPPQLSDAFGDLITRAVCRRLSRADAKETGGCCFPLGTPERAEAPPGRLLRSSSFPILPPRYDSQHCGLNRFFARD